ncbi:MAG: NAD-dependent epimerase/dehydratase family protein [Cyclobacteriaceae bacterium]
MKVIVTGATGMVGKGVLLECFDHPEITDVLSISRRSLGIKHEKLKELIHKDFSEFKSVEDQLKGYDACYHSMGVSATGMSEEDYTHMTFGFSLSLAKSLHAVNPEMTFVYVSGQGTDSSEQGRSMWARVKGKTENDILKLGFRQAFMFRPGGIIPLRGIRSATKLYQFFYDYFMWLLKLIKLMAPYSIVNTTQIGLSMINVTLDGYDREILNPKDIIDTSVESS